MAISGYRGYDVSAAAAAQLRTRFDDLARQASSGQRANTYAGLGLDARQSIDLRAELARRDALTTSANLGAARAEASQAVLTRVNDIATSMTSAASGLLGVNAADPSAVAQTARTALRELVGLMNEQYGGESLFGGSDLSKIPMVEPGEFENTAMFQQIRQQVGSLGTVDAGSIIATTRETAATDMSPFPARAARLAAGATDDPRRAVPIETGVSVEIGLYADRNAGVTSTGDTTGSWMRDMLHGLSILANLGPEQEAQGEDYQELVRGAIGSLRAGAAGVNDEAGALGLAQKQLESAGERHKTISGQVELQVAKLETVDPAEVLVALQAVQTQLQSSYRALAMIGEMSLTNFLR